MEKDINVVCKDCIKKCKQVHIVKIVSCPMKETKSGEIGTKKGRK